MSRSSSAAFVLLVLASLACGGLLGSDGTPSDVPAEPAPAPAEVTKAPNVLLILADDLGTDKVGAYGEHPDAPPTPRIDALAARGMLFDNAYAYATCAPTRAALLTGRYGRRTGFGGTVHLDETTYELPLDEITIPEMLSLAPQPWSNAALGKWQLSGHETAHAFTHPNDQGFSHYAGCLGNLVLTGTRKGRGDYFDFEKVVDGEVGFEKQYATSDTTDDAIEQLGRLAAPWFLYVAYNAPHAPVHVPPRELLSADLPSGATDADKIDAAIEAMDTEIGRLLDAMTPEQRRDTLVIFLGDNGTDRSAIRPPRDPDHGKSSLYEGGTNVPMIVAGPTVPEGVRTAALTHVVDLFPTVAELAGVDLSRLSRDGAPVALDGQSLVPVLRDPAGSGRPFVYTEKFDPLGAGPYDVDWRAVRNERYKVIDVGGRRVSFFDLGHRDDDGPAMRPAQLTPEETVQYEALMAEMARMEEGLSFEH